MTHAMRARKERGAKIVVVDVYDNATMKQADVALILRPGTDGALACAVMHVLFRDGYADRDYLANVHRLPGRARGASAHRATPEWASAISGLAGRRDRGLRAAGRRATQRTFFRLGYGFARSRNGAVNMHAALSIPAVTGAWQYEGGGALHSNGGIFGWNKTLIEGLDVRDPGAPARPVAHRRACSPATPRRSAGGPPVTAMLDPEHQPGLGRARAGAGQARLCPRGPVHLRP